jgi:hypothetical protein
MHRPKDITIVIKMARQIEAKFISLCRSPYPTSDLHLH